MNAGDFNFVEISKDIMPEVKDLPGDLSQVAEIVGVPLTLQLAQRFRGSHVYFRNIDNIIRQQRDVLIRKEYDNGIPISELAVRHRLSTRQIWNILGRL